MKKIYKISVEGKTYEVELEEVKTVEGHVESTPKKEVQTQPVSSNINTETYGNDICAPMPGTVIDIKVNVGDTVKKGQVVAILEAMKMETEIMADSDGKVNSVNISKGDSVILNQSILTII